MPCFTTPAFLAPLNTTVQRLIGAATVLLAVLLATGCAALPPGATRQPSTALEGTGTPLKQLAEASLAGQDPTLSGFRLLPNGDHALDARLALAQRAERSLDLCTPARCRPGWPPWPPWPPWPRSRAPRCACTTRCPCAKAAWPAAC